MRRQNKGLPSGLAAHDVAICGFPAEGMSLAPRVYVSQDAVERASWYEKGASFERKPASSSGFVPQRCDQTRGKGPPLPQTKRLSWVCRVSPNPGGHNWRGLPRERSNLARSFLEWLRVVGSVLGRFWANVFRVEIRGPGDTGHFCQNALGFEGMSTKRKSAHVSAKSAGKPLLEGFGARSWSLRIPRVRGACGRGAEGACLTLARL